MKTLDFNHHFKTESWREIFLAGGCFWGVQQYFRNMIGVVLTDVGYANGIIPETDYEHLKITHHAETVRLVYDQERLSLGTILEHFLRIIDPYSLDRQGNDVGEQYRSGIFYIDEESGAFCRAFITAFEQQEGEQTAIEIDPLYHYVFAETEHQDYLVKNPNGYCHINIAPEALLKPKVDLEKYHQKQLEALSEIEYKVTQEDFTEAPFTGEYNDHYQKGIYVDVVTGEPLFSSSTKFNSGCGWPSFAKPIDENVIHYFDDDSKGRHRIEVRSHQGDSHLGHVFEDGLPELGGLRYCINSAALRFIPFEEMDEQGYGDLKVLVL